MMWYGLKNVKWENKLKNLKLKNKLQIRTLNTSSIKKIRLNYANLFFYLPPNWNLIIFKINKATFSHRVSYLYAKEYFFYLSFAFNHSSLFFNVQTNVLRIGNLFITNFFYTYWTVFKNIFYSFSKVFFKKLKFKGKGYYIYKGFRNTIATQFGYSHMIRISGFLINLKLITKTIIFMASINIFDIILMGKKLFFKRPQNIFTGKGVRFNKQIIYKKTGKISTYR